MKLNWEEIPETLFDYHCGGWFISPQVFPGLCTRRKPPPVSASLQGALVQWLDGAADRRGAEAGWGKNFAAECRGVVAVMPTRSWGPNLCSGSFCSVPTCCQGRSGSLGVHTAGTQTFGPPLFHMSRPFSFSVISSHRPLSPLCPKWPFSLFRLLFFFHSVYPDLCVFLPPIQILLDSDLSCPLLQLHYLTQLWAHTGCSINSPWMKDEYHLEITHSPLLKV